MNSLLNRNEHENTIISKSQFHLYNWQQHYQLISSIFPVAKYLPATKQS
ncbi:hypothetical protein [Pseudolactococcus laudensis]